LAWEEEVSKLLDQYNANSGNLIRAQDSVKSRAPSALFQGENRSKKVLLIPDHISSCEGLGLEQEEDDQKRTFLQITGV
jgi:hypothetical protein